MPLPVDWPERIVRIMHGAEEPDPDWFMGSQWLTPNEQINVYKEQYYLRLIGCVAEEIRGWVGLHGDGSNAVIKRYLVDCPSKSWTLNLIADRFADWLAAHDFPQEEIEMARLDRQVNRGFCAAPGVTPTPEALASMPLLRLQPAVSLLRNRFNVHLIRSAILQERQAPSLTEGSYTLTIFRRGRGMRHMELHPIAFRILECIQEGQAVGTALETVFSEGATTPDLVDNLAGWFKDFTERELVEIVNNEAPAA